MLKIEELYIFKNVQIQDSFFFSIFLVRSKTDL